MEQWTWKNLKYLYVRYNPVFLEATDTLEAIEGVVSKSLEKLTLPYVVDILHDLLKYFKKSTSESAIELSVAKQGYNAIHTAAIGGNAAWTNLQTLHLKYNSIGDEGVYTYAK